MKIENLIVNENLKNEGVYLGSVNSDKPLVMSNLTNNCEKNSNYYILGRPGVGRGFKVKTME